MESLAADARHNIGFPARDCLKRDNGTQFWQARGRPNAGRRRFQAYESDAGKAGLAERIRHRILIPIF